MIHIKLFSSYSFLVSHNDLEDELSPFNYVDILIGENEKCFIKFFPINQHTYSIPFCLPIYFYKNQLDCKMENVKIYKVLSSYEIFISPIEIPVSLNSEIKKIQTQSSFSQVLFNFNLITFKTDKNTKSIFCNLATKNIKSYLNYIIVYGDSINKEKVLVVYNTSTNKIEKYIAKQMELNLPTIKLLVELDTTFKRKTLIELKLAKEKIEIVKKELFKEKDSIDTNNNYNILPYIFLESIKIDDFKTAKDCLSTKLSNVEPNKFKEYFDDFLFIRLLNTSPLEYVLYYKDKAKVFQFILNDDKIEEINEI